MKEIKSVKEFNDLIQADKPVLLDFYADWCGPCQALLPVVEKLAEQYKEDIEIVKLNVDKLPAISQKFKVRSIPALFFVKDQTIQETLVGGQTAAVLEHKIQKHAVTA